MSTTGNDHNGDASGAQRRYWALSSRHGAALMAVYDAGGELPEWDPRAIELAAASDALSAFFRDHTGETFRVFRPEDRDSACTEEASPWDL